MVASENALGFLGSLTLHGAGKGGDKACTAAAAGAARREQEDAADFLHFLLDQAHEELLQLSKAHASQMDAAPGAPFSLFDSPSLPRGQGTISSHKHWPVMVGNVGTAEALFHSLLARSLA